MIRSISQMSTERTTVTVTPIDMGATLRMVWASKIIADLWSYPSARAGIKIVLDNQSLEVFQIAIGAGWESEHAKVNLAEKTLTLTWPDN